MAELSRNDELNKLAQKMGTAIASELRIVIFENGFVTFSTENPGNIKTSELVGAMEVVKSAMVSEVINALVSISNNYLRDNNEKVREGIEDSPVSPEPSDEQGSSS